MVTRRGWSILRECPTRPNESVGRSAEVDAEAEVWLAGTDATRWNDLAPEALEADKDDGGRSRPLDE
jgi:hypothetical protein